MCGPRRCYPECACVNMEAACSSQRRVLPVNGDWGLPMNLTLAERIEAGLRAGNLSWWEMELPSGKVAFDDLKAAMLGYSPDEFHHYEDFTNLLHPDDYPSAMQAMRDHLNGDSEKYEAEYRILTNHGTYKWYRDVGAITSRDEASGYVRVIGIVEDITDRKEAELQLRKALDDRDRLMRELNHRVKNNINLVSSLISLKDNSLGDTVDLSDIQQEVSAIAAIHEKLYQSEDIESIDFGHYVQDLLEQVFSLYSEGQVVIENDIEGIHIPTDLAVTLGLIVNELATNAMKHGFVSGSDSHFSVHMDMIDDRYELRVSNSGRSLPADLDIEASRSLGLQLIQAMIQQINGEITVERSERTWFKISFPKDG